MTPELINEFTLNGKIPIIYKFRDDSKQATQDELNSKYNQDTYLKLVTKAIYKETNYYGETDTWLYNAINIHPLKDKTILIFGSAEPWYETLALTYGAKEVHVLEYSYRPQIHEKIKYLTIDQLNNKYDIGISISSFEHYGLGRYGDPINPNGDLEIMSYAKTKVDKLFLSIPTGYDKLFFNVHRVYGDLRFSLLINDWIIIDRYGVCPSTFCNNLNTENSSPYQPLFILKPS